MKSIFRQIQPFLRSIKPNGIRELSTQNIKVNLLIPKSKAQIVLNAKEGDTLQTIISDSNDHGLLEILPCTCGGIAACSTCHVYVSLNNENGKSN